MTGNGRRDRGWRRAMAIGVAVSILAHAALLAWVRFSIEPGSDGEARAPLRVVPLAAEREPETQPPLEVVELRERTSGGAAAASRAVPATKLALADVAPIPEATPRGTPNPVLFLEALEEREEEEHPAARYARVSDFLVQSSAEPGPFRPIDDRPVDVLARIGAGRGTGMGVGVGGGHCPPRGGLPLRR